MKSSFNFFKTTVLGGLFVVIPLVIVYLLFSEALDLLVSLVSPIAGMLPENWFANVRQARIVALFLLITLSFLTGLVVRTQLGVGAGKWFERTVLKRIPGYGLAKTLTGQISGGEAGSQFAPAVVSMGPDTLVFAYIIEEHDTGYFTVLLPASPVGTAGGLQYVSGKCVRRLEAPLSKVFNCITQYGIGSGPLFIPHTPGATSPEAGGHPVEKKKPEPSE